MAHNDQRRREIVEALRGMALFRGLTDEELAGLAERVVRKRYARNEAIFCQGEPGRGLYIVARGHVGISRQGPQGTELLLTLAGPGEYFGELALFDGAPRSAGATALDDCRLLVLPRDAFRAFLEAHPSALWSCLEVIVGQLRRLTAVADDLALLDLRGRLARCLLRLAEQGAVMVAGARPAERDRVVRITQQHLANMLGATRERVNRQLQALAEEEIIALERGQVRILDRAALEEAGAADM
jgi:CRP/FNR family transcriptional regulator, cyclic AMP receptor protein